jgi:hypothetical protein
MIMFLLTRIFEYDIYSMCFKSKVVIPFVVKALLKICEVY